MSKYFSVSAVLTLGVLALGFEHVAAHSSDGLQFQRVNYLPTQMVGYRTWAESGALLETVRDTYVTLKGNGRNEQEVGWTLTDDPGASTQVGYSLLDYPI